MSDNNPSLEVLKNIVEVVGKLSLGLLAICYVIGLVVVNLHLSNFGIYSLSIFRLVYVTAGLWTLLPLLVSLVYGFLLIAVAVIFSPTLREQVSHRFPLAVDKYEDRITRWVLLFGLLVPIGCSFFALNLLRKMLRISAPASLSSSWFPAIAILTSVFIGATLIIILTAKSFTPARMGGIMYSGICAAIAFVGYVVIFAVTTYGSIPSALGGGGAKEVQFIVSADEQFKTSLINAGVKFQPDSHMTENVRYLFATESEYIILVKSHEGKDVAVTIRSDDVKAILFEGVVSRGSGGGSSW